MSEVFIIVHMNYVHKLHIIHVPTQLHT